MRTRKLLDDLSNLHVFTLEEALKLAPAGDSRRRVRSLLNQYVLRGTLGRVRSGLYYVVPRGRNPRSWVPDRFLVASKLDPEAVLAFHTALELLGGAYSTWNEIYVLASRRHWQDKERFAFQDVVYRMVQPPARLRRQAFTLGVEIMERFGQQIRVTSRTRTLVDCLDRLEYAGGLQELLNSVLTWPSIDAEQLETYMQLLNRRVLYARVGFVLERFRQRWAVPPDMLDRLQERVPKRTTYFDTAPGRARFVRAWRLMVPSELTEPVFAG